MHMELRTHQKEALEVMNHKRKGIICVPTGGGKTMIAIEHAKKLFDRPTFTGHKTIVVVAPRPVSYTHLTLPTSDLV